MRSLLIALVVGLLFGILTAFGQSWLPADVNSLANSSGSWCLVAFCLALLAPGPRSAAAVGALSLGALLAGYVLASALRGYPSSPRTLLFWGLAAVLVGPALGLGAHWVRHGTPARAAAGTGLMSGLLLGEGVFGLTAVAGTTSPTYWWGQITVAVAVLFASAAGRLRRPAPIGLAVAATVAVSAAFLVVYGADLMLLFF